MDILIRKKQNRVKLRMSCLNLKVQVKITDGFVSCSCNFRNRFGIDCPHFYHVVSQSQEFKEPSHHHISVRWWNSFYQFACMSKIDK